MALAVPAGGAANGGASAGLAEDDVFGAAADPAEAIPLSTGLVTGGSPFLACHSNRRACRSSNLPFTARSVAIVSITPRKSGGGPIYVCSKSTAGTLQTRVSERLPRDKSAPSGSPSIVTVAPSDACSTVTPSGSGSLANPFWASTRRRGFSLMASAEDGTVVMKSWN